MLRRLVYRSAPRRPPDSVVLDILRASDARNARLGCSGLLYYGDGTYAQLIEGPEEGVAELWRLIGADPRHRVLWHRTLPAAAREIGTGLPMGFLSKREARADLRYARLVALLADDVLSAPGGPVRAPGLGQALAAAARLKYPVAAMPEAG
ncbi:MAG: FAD-dependent blue-light sensor [Rhodobacteraceae bacterium HLUCCA09]|nr:MAG: FAD-dependent blue-light sensor [Rhodobacteraceae bacterium HLUCCA09]